MFWNKTKHIFQYFIRFLFWYPYQPANISSFISQQTYINCAINIHEAVFKRTVSPFIKKNTDTPVIFLTANDLERDELNGFDLGADDYITKPFSIQVLKRRVEAVLRRGTAGSDCFDDGFLRLDFQALTAARNGERLSITPNEYKLLRLLTANAGAVMTRRLLLEKLWDSGGNFIDDHTLTVTMNRLRAKIEDAGHTYIQTVRGMGYVWTGDQE